MAALDYYSLALRSSRDDFIKTFPFHFLVGTAPLKRPRKPIATQIFENPLEAMEKNETTSSVDFTDPPVPGAPMVLAVRKVQSTFPSMITVGRTANNDVVVADVQ